MGIDLGILTGEILPAADGKVGGHGGKTRLTAASHTEVIQSFCLFPDRSSPPAKTLCHRIQKIQDFFPDLIESGEARGIFVL